MLSMPGWGVAIRNDTTAPLDAPSLRRDIAVGITPQEHRGRGIPINVAYSTELKLPFERYFP